MIARFFGVKRDRLAKASFGGFIRNSLCWTFKEHLGLLVQVELLGDVAQYFGKCVNGCSSKH